MSKAEKKNAVNWKKKLEEDALEILQGKEKVKMK